MTRIITRYRGGSRKLYDRRESRYISLEEIPALIRRGEDVQVLDSRTGRDVTAQTLAQVLYESERRGVGGLSVGLLHDMIRQGEAALRASLDRVPPIHRAQEDARRLQASLERLDRSLTTLEHVTRRRPVRHRRGARIRPVQEV